MLIFNGQYYFITLFLLYISFSLPRFYFVELTRDHLSLLLIEIGLCLIDLLNNFIELLLVFSELHLHAHQVLHLAQLGLHLQQSRPLVHIDRMCPLRSNTRHWVLLLHITHKYLLRTIIKYPSSSITHVASSLVRGRRIAIAQLTHVSAGDYSGLCRPERTRRARSGRAE